MSWLVNSLANSLKLDDDEDENNHIDPTTGSAAADRPIESSSPGPSDQPPPPRGVKDDLSELSRTFTRQLWGVAAFLAPPPPPPDHIPSAAYDPPRIAGIRNDLSEIGGKLRGEISKLSNNKAVSEFTKIASNLLQFGVDEDLSVQDYADRGVVGVTDEVVGFARDVAMHPQMWLDFPLPHDDDDEDSDLSDAQQEHALAVERLAPELAALRSELCLSYMTEGSFWKIYFVLVHPRLNKQDAVILSTPPIMQARAMLTQELQSRGKPRKPDPATSTVSVDGSGLSREEQLSIPVANLSELVPVEILSVEPASSVVHDVEIDRHPFTSTEDPVFEKAVVEEVPVIKKPTLTASKSEVSVDEEDEDEWLKEETESSSFMGTSYPLGNVDDDDDGVNFSDLEEDDDVPASFKKVGQTGSTSKESSTNPSGKESNDWLDIEDIDDA